MSHYPRSLRQHAVFITIGIGAILAFLFGTFPNWNTFVQYFPTFSSLWAIANNRHALLTLVIKVSAPLWVSALMSALYWIFATLRLYWQEATAPSQPTVYNHLPQPSQFETRTKLDFPAIPVVKPQTFPSTATTVSGIHSLIGIDETPTLMKVSETVTGHPSSLSTQEQQMIIDSLSSPEWHEEIKAIQQTSLPSTRDTMQAKVFDEEIEILSLEEERAEAEEGSDVLPQATPDYFIGITLLKEVTVTIHVNQISRIVPLSSNARRVQLLAYLAWRRGQKQYREKILEEVFAHGLSDEEAFPARLTQGFNDHKKLLRDDIRRVIRKINEEAGRTLIPPNLDIFQAHQKRWSISPVTTRVTDLEAIEAEHAIIEKAVQDGLLVTTIPQTVKDACDRLIACYSGDFLESVLRDYEEEFDPWTSSWVREPFTLYRDYYLQAVWYAAEYGLQVGQQLSDDQLNENSPERTAQQLAQQKQYGQAARLYYRYAMHATNSKFDKKLIFSRQTGRGPGERILMSERALRRCLMLYGLIGATHLVDQAYTAYHRHMKRISSDIWQPSPDTLHDLDRAKHCTNAYRLPAQVVLGHEPFPDDTETAKS